MLPLIRTAVLTVLVASPLAACQPAAQPPRDEEAKALLYALLKPDSNHVQLSADLRPTSADYASVFDEKEAVRAETFYGKVWDSGKVVIRPKPGQVDCLFWSATTEELKAGEGDARSFPEGFRKVAEMGKLKPGVRWYRFKFTEQGGTTGLSFDGLTYVNGKWRIFPKPWKVLGTAS